MKKSIKGRPLMILYIAILLIAVLQSCKTGKDSGEPLYLNPKASIGDRVEDLLSRMTLEEKIAQINLSVGHIIVPGDARSKRDSAHIDSLRNMISSGMVGCIYNLKLVDMDMKWVLEPGQFRLMVGSSSEDIRQEGIFKVFGK